MNGHASRPADDAPRSLLRSMLGLHAWAGLMLGWVSFVIFLTGTLAYFQPEITQWMRPQLQQPRSVEHGAATALERLAAVAPAAKEWNVGLPNDRDPSLGISWRTSGSGPLAGRELLNAATGEPVTLTDTLGGRLFYSFHFTLMLPGVGYWIAGAAAMFMLTALISGIIVHKKILADFFTFRPRHSPRRAWLDVHNLTSVLALPFHVAIVYTGLVTLLYSYMPSIMEAAYPDGTRHFFREAFQPRGGETARAERHEVPLHALLGRIRELEAAGAQVADLHIVDPSEPSATAAIGLGFEPASTFVSERNLSGVANLYDSLYEFHLGRFADWAVRWLLFASGLAGTAMVATGLLVWSLKRRERAATAASRIGCFLVDRLNVAVIGGCLLAIAAFFLANRLLPAALDDRDIVELRCFFGAWAAAGLHAFLRPLDRAWREQLWLLAAALGALPLVSGATTGRHLFASLGNADWLFVAFDGIALAVAAFAGAAAWRLARHARSAAARRDEAVPAVPDAPAAIRS